jgi:hypothetical protein
MYMAWAHHWFWSKLVDPADRPGATDAVELPPKGNGANGDRMYDSNGSNDSIPKPVEKVDTIRV